MDISDRVKGQLTQFILRVMNGVNFHPLFVGQVVTQHEDHTLDLRMESPLLPGLTRVPIAHGLPGTIVRVTPGAHVLVGFRNGNPMLPFVAGWLGADVVEIRLGGGGDPIALESKVMAELEKIRAELNRHQHAYVVQGVSAPTTGGASLAELESVGAEKVKAY